MAAKGKPAPAPVPEFTGDRMRLLGPLITPRVLEIARNRLITHTDRVDKLPDDVGTLRLALLLVREMNPFADLTNPEEGILRGISAETVGARKAAGEL